MHLRFYIPGPLREFTGGEAHVHLDLEADGSQILLKDALEALWRVYPPIRYRVLTEQGTVREHINIFVGDESIRYTGGLQTMLDANAEIFIIPAVSGG